MRQRKPANIEGELQLYAAAIVGNPFFCKGQWRSIVAGRNTPDAETRELRVDLGCGKGAWLAQVATANPDILFLGLDNNEVCVARTAAKLVEAGVSNAKVALLDADHIDEAFAPKEINHLYLNFSSPFPPKKYAWKRLTHLDRLMTYRGLLGEDGVLDMRTDHDPLWQFSLLQLDAAGYDIFHRTDDLRNHPEGFDVFISEYDQLTVSRGAIVHAMQAHPGQAPLSAPQQNAPLGLVDYLPDNLESLERIPYGMEGTVENLRNRARNHRGKYGQ